MAPAAGRKAPKQLAERISFQSTQIDGTMSSREIGPALPPGFKQSSSRETEAGPSLPPNWKSGGNGNSSDSSSDSCSDSSSSDNSGSHNAKRNRRRKRARHAADDDPPPRGHSGYHVTGSSGSSAGTAAAQGAVIGPVMPPGFAGSAGGGDPESEGDSDPDCYGPRPQEGGSDPLLDSAAYQLEERSRKMKRKLLGQDDGPQVVVRETWMTELPSVKKKISGLTARKLTTGVDISEADRRHWTETPAEKAKRLEEYGDVEEPPPPVTVQAIATSERDQFMAEQVKIYNEKRRQESLLEMHTKKLQKPDKKKKKKDKKEKKDKKKKKKKDKEKAKTEKAERRPFDRDVDLQVNRFDHAQRQSLIKRSQELNSKFSSGGQAFL